MTDFPTVNPVVPATDSDLESSVVRDNFAASYNDLLNLQGQIDDISYGSMAAQNSDSVSITGGVIDGTTVGLTTPAAAKITNLEVTGTFTPAANSLQYGSIQQVSTTALLGNHNAGAHDIEEILINTTLDMTSGTLGVVNNTSTQKVIVAKAGSTVGTRDKVNLIEGSGITLTVSDNSGSDRVDVTVAATGSGGSVTSVATGTGLTGGPITTSGTVSVAPDAHNSLAGYNNSGTFSNVTVGTGLSLSSGTLTATGAGSVTSVAVSGANGISVSGSPITSTGTIALGLNNITPTTVNALTLASQAVGFTVAGGTTSKTLTVPLDATVSGTNTGDQFIFKTIAVSGQSDVVADTTADTLTLAAGSNITITTNAGTDTVTIASSGGGAVTSVANSDGTLTVSPTTGDVVASLDLTHANTWTGKQTFNTSSIQSGTLTASKAVVSDGSKNLISSTTSATEIGYVGGVTSAIQTQIDTKQATGNYITALTGDVTASGPGSVASTVAKIAGTTVSGTTGSGNVVFSTSPTLVTPILGTPQSGVATNLTGTASGLTAGNVTTNANLTGPITSVGNATAIASQTGTGTKFVVDTSPTLVTPNIGVATGTSLAASGVMSTGANSGTNGQITFNGSTSGSVAVKAAAAAGTGTIFQLPSSNGTNGYVLQTNGSGVTSWVAESGGIGGSTGATDNSVLRANGTGGATLQSSLVSILDDGNIETPAGLTVGEVGTVSGYIGLRGFTSGTCTLQVPDIAGSSTNFTLPANNGTADYFLKTDGAGNTSWSTIGGGGGVSGPVTSTDNALSIWNGTGGDALDNTDITVVSNYMYFPNNKGISTIDETSVVNISGWDVDAMAPYQIIQVYGGDSSSPTSQPSCYISNATNIYGHPQGLLIQASDINTAVLSLEAYDTDTDTNIPFIVLTSGSTPTCDLDSSVTVGGSAIVTSSVTTLSSLASIGTITTGVWHGTKIGLAYGGTNADLSATGGTSQVLRQSSSGANITVGQLAASDLSNGTTGSGGGVVLATGPTMSNPVVGTQTQGDNSTKAASTAYVDTAVAGKQSTSLTSAHILVGNVSNVASDVAMSGDIIITNAGATTVAKIAGVTVSGTTGTVNSVFSTSPTLVTPTLGVASATSLATSAASPLLLTNGQLVTVALTSQTTGGATLTIPDFASVSDEFTFKTKSQTMSNKTFIAPILGTPTSGNLSNCTALPVGSITGLGSGVATWLATPSSANLASAVTDETGSGSLVFATTPTLVTPVLGVATATSVNKMAITAPATSSTLAVADGKTFTASNTITLTGTDTVSANVSNLKIRTIGFSATTPVTGQQGSYVVFPVAGTITGWSIVADAGTATVNVWKIASGTAAPTVSNLINTSGVSLATGTAIISSTTSDFTTTTVAANDIFAFSIGAVATATKLMFELQITVT